MSDWLYLLIDRIMSKIVTSLLTSPLIMTNKYIQTIATIPAALFLVGILSLGIQISFNLMDIFGTPLKQESKEIREPLINNAGLYLYVICFFLILVDQIVMLKVDIIFDMYNSFKLISDYSNYLTKNSLIILEEIKRNLVIIKTDSDKLSCITLPNNIDDDVKSLMSRINNVVTAINKFQTYIDTGFINADKYNSDPGSVKSAVVFFYLTPIAFGALYVYCHYNRKLKFARLSVHIGCLWFIVLLLGASAWFFVTIFISKLCSNPKQEFATLVAYLVSSGKDTVTFDRLKDDAEYYSSCKGQGTFDKSILSLTSSTTNLYDAIKDYSNTCSMDSTTTSDMKLHLQLLLHYYKTWAELLKCDNMKKVYYDGFIETDVCHSMFVGAGAFWLSQILCSVFTLSAIVALSYAYKLYDSDRFDADGNLIKPKKKRRRIKWYDVRDVTELRKKAAEQAKLRTTEDAGENEGEKNEDKMEKGEGEDDNGNESDDGVSEKRPAEESNEANATSDQSSDEGSEVDENNNAAEIPKFETPNPTSSSKNWYSLSSTKVAPDVTLKSTTNSHEQF